MFVAYVDYCGMERIAGFEPALLVWKTNVLTVEHYIRVLSVF